MSLFDELKDAVRELDKNAFQHNFQVLGDSRKTVAELFDRIERQLAEGKIVLKPEPTPKLNSIVADKADQAVADARAAAKKESDAAAEVKAEAEARIAEKAADAAKTRPEPMQEPKQEPKQEFNFGPKAGMHKIEPGDADPKMTKKGV